MTTKEQGYYTKKRQGLLQEFGQLETNYTDRTSYIAANPARGNTGRRHYIEAQQKRCMEDIEDNRREALKDGFVLPHAKYSVLNQTERRASRMLTSARFRKDAKEHTKRLHDAAVKASSRKEVAGDRRKSKPFDGDSSCTASRHSDSTY